MKKKKKKRIRDCLWVHDWEAETETAAATATKFETATNTERLKRRGGGPGLCGLCAVHDF